MSVTLRAAEVDVDRARQVAINQMNDFILAARPAAKSVRPLIDQNDVGEMFIVSHRARAAYYVFNFESGGWVIVAANDVVTPVLAYSEVGRYSDEGHPPAFDAWMTSIAEKIHIAAQADLAPANVTIEEWSLLQLPTAAHLAERHDRRLNNAKEASAVYTTPFYLLDTIWGQGLPIPVLPIDFNMYCPCVTEVPVLGCVERVPTGCVATAMAQVMNFWQWPLQGTGSHCYNHSTFGQQCADFGGTNYDWLMMELFPVLPTVATATLMRHCGVAVDMIYGPWESSAYLRDSVPAMAKYFNYDCGTYMWRDQMSDSDWLDLVTAELDAGRPVLYGAVSADGGHAIICDGHDGAGRLHMNWGWDVFRQTLFNGYYTLDLHLVDLGALIDIKYDSGHEAVIDIHPIYLPPQVAAEGDKTILSEDQADGELLGFAIDPDGGLKYMWSDGSTALTWNMDGSSIDYKSPWLQVPENGIARLNLGEIMVDGNETFPYFEPGTYELAFDVKDCVNTFPRSMTLTVENSPPHVTTDGGGTFEVGKPVPLGGSVWDFDGDLVEAAWREGTTTYFTDTTSTPGLTDEVTLPSHVLSSLSVGTHVLTLEADDGVNPPVGEDITITVADTIPPTIEVGCDPCELWPPNHKMVGVQVPALVSDNSGGVCDLAVVVTSNEPDDGLGDGDRTPDWTEPVIDPQSGMIVLQLRAERSGSGSGRVYTIAVTATDPSGNAAETSVDVVVGHDMRK